MPIIKEDPLRKYNPDGFSFKSVKGEVSEAMQFDWKRDKVDDAKKRAIHDARSYDEFKDRVAGCTLKPIHRNEFNAPPKFTFNNHVGDKPLGSTSGPTSDAPKSGYIRPSGNADAPVFTEKVPKNGHEFDRELRRKPTSEDKVRLIQAVLDQTGLVARLFSRELDGEMFRQVLAALDEVAIPGTVWQGIARRFLVALATECPVSITSACSFFDAEERETLARLLARDAASDAGEDVRVCAAFGISLSSVSEAAAKLPDTAAQPAEEAPAAPVETAADDDSKKSQSREDSANCGGMD